MTLAPIDMLPHEIERRARGYGGGVSHWIGEQCCTSYPKKVLIRRSFPSLLTISLGRPSSVLTGASAVPLPAVRLGEDPIACTFYRESM